MALSIYNYGMMAIPSLRALAGNFRYTLVEGASARMWTSDQLKGTQLTIPASFLA